MNEAIRAHDAGQDHAEGLTVDISRIDFEKLRAEFAGKVRRKHAALQDIRDVVEKKLAEEIGPISERVYEYVWQRSASENAAL